MNSSRFNSIGVILLILAGVLLYGHTLSFPFVFDDHIYLVNNPLVKDGRSFGYHGDFVAFSTCSKRMGLDPDLSTNFILRPVTYLTFYVNYVIDGMNPRGFRAVNIGIHCANAVLLFMLLLRLLGGSRKSGSLTAVSEGFIALTAALLFLAHPLQTESVTYIVQRFTSLSAFFYLFTIVTYLVSYASANKTSALFYRCVSVAGFVVGMLSKETVFTAPFMLVAMDWLVMGIPLKTVWKRTMPYFFCLPVIPAMILLTSWAQHSGNASLADAFNITNPYSAGYQYHYALTQLSVVLSYLRLILVPMGLNLDWDYPLSTSLLSGRVLASAATIAGIVGGAGFWYCKQREDARRSLFFCSILWFFVTLAISSSVVPLPDLMVEHRCYVASIGAVTALACCLDMLRTLLIAHGGNSYVVHGCAAAWVLGLGAATFARNEVWRSEIGIWSDATVKSPRKFRPQMNLGVACVEQGKPKEGIACFRKALQIEPALISGYENLAMTENSLHNYREALSVTEAGLMYVARNSKLEFCRGAACYGLGQIKESIPWFKKASDGPSMRKPAHFVLGVIYAEQKQYDKALKHYRIAASLPAFQEFDAQLRYNITNIESVVDRAAGSPVAMSGR